MCTTRVAATLAALTWMTTGTLAQVEIAATVQPGTVSVGETVTYEITVIIRGASALTAPGEPTLPDFNGFEVLSTGSRQGFSVGTDGTEAQRVYTYTLRALRAGDFTIAPATLQVGGTKYTSAPVQVTVTPGTPPQRSSPFAPPEPPEAPDTAAPDESGFTPSEAIDLHLSAEPRAPYVGQQVTVTFAFYQSENLHGDTRYEPPSAENCVMKELPSPANATRAVGRRQYLVQKRRWALFPTAAGPLRVKPVRVVTGLNSSGPRDEMYTNTVTLDVKPLPAPPSASLFDGAVGKFTAELTCEPVLVKAGETLNICLTVRGTGNIHSLGVPAPQVPEWVDIYNSREERTADAGYGGDADVIGGEARFHFLALAKKVGVVDVPPVELVYFDPDRRRYETATSGGVSIRVEPGPIVEMPPEQTGPQMRLIKRADMVKPARPPLLTCRWFWAVQVVPLLLLALFAYLSHRRNLLMADQRLARALQAARVAQAHLRDARAALRREDGTAFYAAAAHAITDFIGHRCGLQAADISTTEALAALQRHGVGEDLIDRVRHILDHCDRGRFAGSTQAEHDAMLAATGRVIKALQAGGLGRR